MCFSQFSMGYVMCLRVIDATIRVWTLYVSISFRCMFGLVTYDLLFIRNPQAPSSKYAACRSVLFFPLRDVTLLRYLGVICLLVQQSVVFIALILPHLCFWECFFPGFPVDLIIETFQQRAGENITPKVLPVEER